MYLLRRNKTCYTRERFISHIRASHVTHTREPVERADAIVTQLSVTWLAQDFTRQQRVVQSVEMNWPVQVPRIDQSGAYGDPFAMPGGGSSQSMQPPGLSAEEQHFFSSGTTREYEEMARRKAEHMESAEHIAPQHNYPASGKTARCIC